MMSSRISQASVPATANSLARVAQYLSFHRGWRLVGGHSASRYFPGPVLSTRGIDRRGFRAAHRQWRSAASRFRHADPTHRRLRAGRMHRHRGGRDHGTLAPCGRYFVAAREHRRSHSRSRLRTAVSVVVWAGQYSRYRAGRLRLCLSGHLQFLDRGESGEGDLAALGASDGCRRPPPVSPCRAAGCATLYRHRAAARSGPGLAHSGCGRDARGGAVGPGLADFRRAGIPQHRRDAGRHCCDRADRVGRWKTSPSCAGA
jgi:hypothetical protein